MVIWQGVSRTAPPADDANRYEATACPGGRAPHAWLADGASLYDRLGFDYTLLVLRGSGDAAGSAVANGEDNIATAFAQAAAARGVPLQTFAPASPELREAYGADYALIRPDQVVVWRGDALAADVGTVLDHVTGRASIATVPPHARA